MTRYPATDGRPDFSKWSTPQLVAYAIDCLGLGGRVYYEEMRDAYPSRRRGTLSRLMPILKRAVRVASREVREGKTIPVVAALLAAVLARHASQEADVEGWVIPIKGRKKKPAPLQREEIPGLG